jgi:hypothetical protein
MSYGEEPPEKQSRGELPIGELPIVEWATTAWVYVFHLARKIGPRGSTTENEKRAAQFVRAEMVRFGIPFDWQSFYSPKSAWRPFSYILGTAVFAAIIAPLFNPVTGIMAAVLLLLALWLMVQELNLRDTPLRSLLPHGPSQNVIGRLAPAKTARQRVVLVAHLDSHRTPHFHQSPERQHLFSLLLILAFVGLPLNAALFLLLAVTDWVWPYVVALPFVLVHLSGMIITLQVDGTPYSPGANDNASSVGVLLTMAEWLAERPLVHTELWFLFSGCEEVGCYGMRAFLDEYGDELGDACFIDFEMVAQGIPGVLEREGILTQYEYDPELIQLAQEAAAAVWQPALRKTGGAYGESVVTKQRGFRSVTLNAVLPHTGEPAAWHRPDDNMSAVDRDTLGQMVVWGMEIVRRLDARV